MAVLNKEGITDALKKLIGDKDDDDTLKLLEDLTDTYDTYNDSEDWKSKYEENDKQWRERYKARFFDGDSENEGETGDTKKEEAEDKDGDDITVDDLFEEEKEKGD